MKHARLFGLLIILSLLTAGCSWRQLIGLPPSNLQNFTESDEYKKLQHDPSMLCKNQDYTTEYGNYTLPYLGIFYPGIIQLNKDSLSKLSEGIWWENCNANSFFNSGDVLKNDGLGSFIGGSAPLPGYNLVRNIGACTQKYETYPMTNSANYLPYLFSFGAISAPGDPHVRDYLALNTLSDLNCLELLSLPALTTNNGLNNPANATALHTIDITPLKNLINLKALSLNGYYVGKDLTPLTSLKRLEALDLSHVTTTGLALGGLARLPIQSLQTLHNLMILNLSYTRTEDLGPLQDLTNLQVLDVSHTLIEDGIFGGLARLNKLTQLQELYVGSTAISELAPLEKLTNLTKLDLSNTKISKIAPLRNLAKLQELNLSHNPFLLLANEIVDKMKILSGLTSLKKLDVRDTGIVPSLCQELKKSLPQTQVIC